MLSHGIKQIHAGYFGNNSPDIIFDFLMYVKCVFFCPVVRVCFSNDRFFDCDEKIVRNGVFLQINVKSSHLSLKKVSKSVFSEKFNHVFNRSGLDVVMPPDSFHRRLKCFLLV